MASAKQKGELPTYDEFVKLNGATRDIVLWLEVEEPALAELTPIRHSAALHQSGILEDGPGELYQAYKVAFNADEDRAKWASERSDALDVQWENLKTFPAYWWLSKQPGWRNVFNTLENNARPARAVAYRHGLARFRLLGIIAYAVGSYKWRKRTGWEPNIASPADVRKALSDIRRLMKTLSPAVLSVNPMDISMLFQYLKIAETILERGPEPHIPKKRKDETLLERGFLEDVIARLDRAFGEASQTLVGHIASIAGYAMPETTFRRVRASVQAKHAIVDPDFKTVV